VDVRGLIEHRRSTVVAVASGVALLTLVALALSTVAWAGTLAEEERLLPGTVVAGVDGSDQSVAEAAAAVTGLETGQGELTAAMYERLTDRWRLVEALESAN
jgi:hypothetical protein